MNPTKKDIFERMLASEAIPMNDPEYPKLFEAVSNTIERSAALNTSTSIGEIRGRLSEIIGQEVDESTTLFIPFHTNFGRHIRLGKNVFINHGCSFLDLGGIAIKDGVMIGPRVNLVTEDHPVDPTLRKTLVLKPIVVKRNAWIAANATILPGVTIGENAVVAAGAVVRNDVPDNTVVAGIPARVVKSLV
jgi:acetyltransferase-like isoleucine patch superfamily enzyme